MAEKELAEIVGSENVLDNDEVLEEYCKDISFVSRIKPKCVVKLNKAEEVEKLVRWANKTLTPLVPISSGPPHLRGDTVPGIGGAVIADLRGINKIITIDSRNRVAMIEPGVTFSELSTELAKEGLRLNMPFLPRSSKSVMGSMLEREPVIMPIRQWDSQDPLNCIEAVFGSGDIFRTGSAAGPAPMSVQKKTGQAQVSGLGPGQLDFARVLQGSQGTMGIVTWATVRCELLPTQQKPFIAATEKYEKLPDFIYRLLWLKVGDELLVLNNSCLAATLATGHEEYTRLKDILPQWVLFFCLSGYEYFPEHRIKYQEMEMLEAAQQFGVKPVKKLPGISANEMLKLLSEPSEEPYWKLRYKGSFESIFFLTTLNRVPEFIEVMYHVAAACEYPSSDIGIYVQPMVQGTSCHCEFNIFYDPANAREVARVKELYTSAGEALINAGAFFSRPYGALADITFRRDGETTACLRKVKRIMDPNGIMNTGKLCF